jgi:Domain of unknown function (DUF4965)/Domain of unknown function (DUF5127)/Domain of unknown function (DUF1793)/Domain of unknown function (DUF4964)
MKDFWLIKSIPIVFISIVTTAVSAQQDTAAFLRAPATPLVVHDPYFSIWSDSNRLTDEPTKHWTGVAHGLNGIVRVDGKNHRYLGNGDRRLPALEETHREITPTRTLVVMQSQEIELSITFLTPAFPDDLRVMARPITYVTWDVKSRDIATHEVALYLDADGAIATNSSEEPVVWSRAQVDGLSLLRVGTSNQPVLEKYGDNLRIDWGYFYIAVPQSGEAVELAAGNSNYRNRFVSTGHLPQEDDLAQPRMPQSRYPAPPSLGIVLPLGTVGSTAVTRHVLLGYDDIYPVEYMHQKLQAYWHKEFTSFSELLKGAERDYLPLKTRAEQYDAGLERDLVNTGGSEYAAIATLAFRQAIGAHKLVEDANGIPFFLPKENFSNGSISTVDVIYPSSPMFLFLNPKLVEAQMEPVMRYAQTARWKFSFAPHDLGVYPLANGQLYGGGEVSEEDQMPVEESGDMILMVAAVAHAERNADFAARYWPLLTKWAEYLLANGFDPDNQLSTDDFAGHLAHNTNLSIKAIEALAAYSQLAEKLGDHRAAAKYETAAKSMAAKWMPMAKEGDHYRLAFDKADTWSQKYNLVWDSILDLHIFPADVAVQEIAFYKIHLNPFGLPLDNRATYTKLDWTVWSATLARDPADFRAIVHPIFQFLNQTPDRVPMTDWYDTISSRKVGFQARSVVGGVYIKLLTDPGLWNKWVDRANQINNGSAQITKQQLH